jgi:hypothetical protein
VPRVDLGDGEASDSEGEGDEDEDGEGNVEAAANQAELDGVVGEIVHVVIDLTSLQWEEVPVHRPPATPAPRARSGREASTPPAVGHKPIFQPGRNQPGPRLRKNQAKTPKDVFRIFWTDQVLLEFCNATNAYA